MQSLDDVVRTPTLDQLAELTVYLAYLLCPLRQSGINVTLFKFETFRSHVDNFPLLIQMYFRLRASYLSLKLPAYYLQYVIFQRHSVSEQYDVGEFHIERAV